MFDPTSAAKHRNNSAEIHSKELMKCETTASAVLRITIATGETRGNKKSLDEVVWLMEGR